MPRAGEAAPLLRDRGNDISESDLERDHVKELSIKTIPVLGSSMIDYDNGTHCRLLSFQILYICSPSVRKAIFEAYAHRVLD